MPGLLHELIFARAERTPSAIALRLRDAEQDYATLAEAVGRFAAACAGRDLEAAGRVAIWLPKRFETVAAIFGACAAGGAFVPVNPLLKPEQVGYILRAETIVDAHRQTFALGLRLADAAPAPVELFNIGGGFGIPYFPGETRLDLAPIADNLETLLPQLAARQPQARPVIELGRYLVGEAGIYDRHDYVPEMRAALQRWADHVDRIVSGEALDNVVEMRGR